MAHILGYLKESRKPITPANDASALAYATWYMDIEPNCHWSSQHEPRSKRSEYERKNFYQMACYNTSCIIHNSIDSYINTITSIIFAQQMTNVTKKELLKANNVSLSRYASLWYRTHTCNNLCRSDKFQNHLARTRTLAHTRMLARARTHYPTPKSQPKTNKQAFSFVYHFSTTLSNEFPLKIALFWKSRAKVRKFLPRIAAYQPAKGDFPTLLLETQKADGK